MEGTYVVDWHAMDGVKGSSRRGVRAVERVEIDWEIVIPEKGDKTIEKEEKAAVKEEEKLTAKEKTDEGEDQVLIKAKEENSGSAHVGKVDSDAEEGVKTYGVEGEAV